MVRAEVCRGYGFRVYLGFGGRRCRRERQWWLREVVVELGAVRCINEDVAAVV
jgi:hypothetical protein